MPYTITHLEEKNILEAIYRGRVKPTEVMTAITKLLFLAKKHKTNLFLIDCLELIDDKALVFENYKLGVDLTKITQKIPEQVKDAIILPRSPQAADNIRFFETVAINRGLNIRLFKNREDALEWLLEN
jgi:hypothetical protein